jgi:hypothetical protein
MYEYVRLGSNGKTQSVYRPAAGWTIRRPNPGGGEVFLNHQGLLWGLTNILYNGYWGSFPEAKRPRRGVDHHSHYGKVKERAERVE